MEKYLKYLKYLQKNFKNPFPNAGLYYIEKTTSTMTDSLELIEGLKKKHKEDTISGTVVMAGYQEQGRGRIAGRKWNSAKGKNLLFTLTLSNRYIKFPLLRLPLLSGTALLMVIEELINDLSGAGTGGIPKPDRAKTKSVKIKWPNDLIYNNRKLAGIICESHGDYSLVGVGLNCNEEFKLNSQEYKPVSLKEILHRELDLFVLLRKILSKFKWYIEKNNKSSRSWVSDLEDRLLGINKRVRYKRGVMENYEGYAVLKGIDYDGALLLKTEDGRVFRLVSGEIELLR